MGTILSGQSMNAQIYGNVKDEDGKALKDVEVSVTNIKNNALTTTTTGKKGTFRLLSLAPSTYQASFDLDGYLSYVLSGIQLSAEQSVNLQIKLKKKE